MTQPYPEESIQSLFPLQPSWWVRGHLARGSLVWALVPYAEQKPFRLVPVGRGDDDRQHGRAAYHLEEFRVDGPVRRTSTLPVAPMPLHDGEEYMVRRSKKRPCLILGETSVTVEPALARGKSRWQTSLARLVVPYYSANGSTSREGWNPELVDRIRRGEYPQYFWDHLPMPTASPEGSILRLDHAFAMGADIANIRLTGFRLHPEALRVLDDWLAWYVTDELRSDDIRTARDVLRQPPA